MGILLKLFYHDAVGAREPGLGFYMFSKLAKGQTGMHA